MDKKWESYWRLRNENLLDDAETLKLRKDGTISEIGKKPKSLDEIDGQYMGLMKFSNKGIKHIKKVFHAAEKNSALLGRAVENAYMTDLLQAVIDANKLVTAVPINGEWVEIDTIGDLNISITTERLREISHG